MHIYIYAPFNSYSNQMHILSTLVPWQSTVCSQFGTAFLHKLLSIQQTHVRLVWESSEKRKKLPWFSYEVQLIFPSILMRFLSSNMVLTSFTFFVFKIIDSHKNTKTILNLSKTWLRKNFCKVWRFTFYHLLYLKSRPYPFPRKEKEI